MCLDKNPFDLHWTACRFDDDDNDDDDSRFNWHLKWWFSCRFDDDDNDDDDSRFNWHLKWWFSWWSWRWWQWWWWLQIQLTFEMWLLPFIWNVQCIFHLNSCVQQIQQSVMIMLRIISVMLKKEYVILICSLLSCISDGPMIGWIFWLCYKVEDSMCCQFIFVS